MSVKMYPEIKKFSKVGEVKACCNCNKMTVNVLIVKWDNKGQDDTLLSICVECQGVLPHTEIVQLALDCEDK